MGVKKHERSLHYALPASVYAELDHVRIDAAPHIPREREMKLGPMMGYLGRWFLTQSPAEQVKILKRGREIEVEKRGAEEAERNRPLPRLGDPGLSIPKKGDTIPDRPIGVGDGGKIDASGKDGVPVAGKGRRPRARK